MNKKSQIKLLKLHLIKLNTYKTLETGTLEKGALDKTITEIEFYLKKILKIIYEYHVNKKTMYFVGFPKESVKFFRSTVFKKTKHRLLPNEVWVKGALINKKYASNSLKKKFTKKIINYKDFLSVLKTPDLVIVLEFNKLILKECSQSKIPIISFYNLDTKLQTYSTIGNYKMLTKNINSFFFSILYSIFKKSKKLNKIRKI